MLALAKLALYDSPPTAILTVTTVQAAFTSGTFTAVQFDTTVSDTWSGHSNVTNNSRYTAPMSGTYWVRAATRWANNVTGNRSLGFRVSGTNIAYAQTQEPAATGTDTTLIECTSILPVTAGQYIEVFAAQDSGGSLSLSAAGTSFQVAWLHF